MCWASAVAGLAATKGWDLWGWAKNTTLYVRPSTLRYTANGYAILCRRGDVQRVIHEFVTYYQSKVTEYRGRQRYPMNGPVEIRVTGLDQPDDVGIEGAWGHRVVVSNLKGDAYTLQSALKFRF